MPRVGRPRTPDLLGRQGVWLARDDDCDLECTPDKLHPALWDGTLGAELSFELDPVLVYADPDIAIQWVGFDVDDAEPRRCPEASGSTGTCWDHP